MTHMHAAMRDASTKQNHRTRNAPMAYLRFCAALYNCSELYHCSELYNIDTATTALYNCSELYICSELYNCGELYVWAPCQSDHSTVQLQRTVQYRYIGICRRRNPKFIVEAAHTAHDTSIKNKTENAGTRKAREAALSTATARIHAHTHTQIHTYTHMHTRTHRHTYEQHIHTPP